MKTQTKTRLTLALFGLALVGMVTSYLFTRPAPLPDNTLKINGRTEANHYLIATKLAGRLIKTYAKEGDNVMQGQKLAQLDDNQVRAKVTQAAAAYGAALAQYRAAQTQLKVLKQQIPLKIDTAQAAVTHAKAQLKAAKAAEQQALKDYQRMKTLHQKGTLNQHRVEQAHLALKTAKANRITAETAVDQALKALNEAQLGWQQLKAQQDQVEAIRSQTLQAQAGLMEAMSVLHDLTLTAPITGTLTTQLSFDGEVLAPGSGVFDLINLDEVYLKGYVPEKQIGLVHLGQKVKIQFDSLPQPYDATVKFISAQAEFTPKDVQTQDERVKQVYAVKFYLDQNPQHRITPGLPADVYIQTDAQ